MTFSTRAVNSRFASVKSELLNLPLAAKVLVLIASVLVLFATLTIVIKLFGFWIGSVDRIDDAESRLARLAGYVESEAQFVKAASQSKSMAARIAFPDSGESGRGGALLQQTVRQLAGDAGLTITGSELQSPEGLDVLAKMTVGLAVTGEPEELVAFLGAVSRNKPLLSVQSINLANVSRRIVRGRPSMSDEVSAELVITAYSLASEQGGDSVD